jgi:AcrR family transcriptional regulator
MYLCSIMTSDLKRKTSELRQRHVLEAAIRVLKRDGYRAATVRSIAREAGVSDGTIYNVFDSKEALLISALNALLGDALTVTDSAQPSGAQQTNGEIERLILDRWKGLDPEAFEIVRIIWSEALQDHTLAARYLKTVAGPAMAARTIMAMFLGLVLLKLFGDPTLEAQGDAVAATAARILDQGLKRRAADA